MDLLNLGGDERLDLPDVSYALNQVPAGLVNELTGSFLVPAGTNTIISGFQPTGSGQGPVQVGASGTPNTALLGQRIAGAITQGVFTAVGPPSISLSVSSLPANTYGIFVRFNRLPGATQTRKFRSKAPPGLEYAQLADTRLVAAWEARLELSSPSAEWLQIGQVVVTAAGSGQGSTITVTDQRPLYFEGTSGNAYAPAWGSAADRVADRRQTTIVSLQQELDALRQCIVDIKGRGLATWAQPNISGMQIGTNFGLTDAPAPNTIAIGDNSFYLSFAARSGPPPQGLITLALNGNNDGLVYDRSSGYINRSIAGNPVATFTQVGSAILGSGGQVNSAFLTLNQWSQANGYGLAIRTNSSGTPAAAGLFSTSATSAFIELGPTPGSLYGALYTSWGGSPTTQLWANSRPFLSGVASGSSTAVSILGSSVSVGSTGAALTVGGRPTPLGGLIWATGYYSYGRNAVFLSGVPGLTASATQNQSDTGIAISITINFSASVPVANIVLVTPVYGQGGSGAFNNRSLAAQYVVNNGNQVNVRLYNDNAELVCTDFSFAIFYGS